jgi:hypothetical protein
MHPPLKFSASLAFSWLPQNFDFSRDHPDPRANTLLRQAATKFRVHLT